MPTNKFTVLADKDSRASANDAWQAMKGGVAGLRVQVCFRAYWACIFRGPEPVSVSFCNAGNSKLATPKTAIPPKKLSVRV